MSESHTRSLWMLSALGALVLVAACANLATLLLARGESRQREVAIQAAIGADRWRIFGQAITESVLLAGLGALLGLAIAGWGSRALLTLMSSRLETLSLELSLDPRVLAGAAVLLSGTLWHLRSFDAGFHRQGVLLVGVDAERAQLAPEALRFAYREALRSLRNDPVVRAATVTSVVPISGGSMTQPVVPDEADPDGGTHYVYSNDVGDGYFETSGTRLVDGRGFSEDGAASANSAPPVAHRRSGARR